jgi:hypothetical protein
MNRRLHTTLLLAIVAVAATACADASAERVPTRSVSPRLVAHAVILGAASLEVTDSMQPDCGLTESTYGAEFDDYEYDCSDGVHCGVEPRILIDGKSTTFFYCTRPTGDSFDFVEACMMRSRGETWFDASRTAALSSGDYFPCPYHWEDAPSAWGDDPP